jgi:hypothetical protein
MLPSVRGQRREGPARLPETGKGAFDMGRKTAQVVLQEGEFYTIGTANGKVLEVADYNTENGAAIRLWDYEGQPWQQWTFVPAGADSYRILNRFTGKVFDLAFGGTINGTWLHQWAQTAANSQKWQLLPTESGKTRIRSVHAGKSVDLVDMNTKNGAQAQIWSDIEGGNQEWDIRRVDEKAVHAAAPAPRRAAARKESPAQRKHANDMLKQINNAGRKESHRKHEEETE